MDQKQEEAREKFIEEFFQNQDLHILLYSWRDAIPPERLGNIMRNCLKDGWEACEKFHNENKTE